MGNLSVLSKLYDKSYYVGKIKSNYDDYANCEGVLTNYAKIIEKIFHPTSVFDCACAYGFLVDYFLANNTFAKGIDCSAHAIRQSKTKNVYQANANNIPENENTFELVSCSECMEHIPENEVRQVLNELYRISSKYIVLLIQFAKSEEGIDDVGSKEITHITLKFKSWWEEIFKELNMKRDYEKEYILNNHKYSKEMNWNDRFFVIKK